MVEMQFVRCLDQHLSLRLSEADYDYLVSKYGDRARGTVDYRAFCKAMEDGMFVCEHTCGIMIYIYIPSTAFDPAILDGKPQKQIEAFQQ